MDMEETVESKPQVCVHANANPTLPTIPTAASIVTSTCTRPDTIKFMRRLGNLRRRQLRETALALGLVAPANATRAWLKDRLTRAFYQRPHEADKALEAVARGVRRPHIVKRLLPLFDACVDAEAMSMSQ